MILNVVPRLRDTLTRGFLILDWMEAELIAQKCGGPYYAPNPLRGGAPKGADADFAPRLRDHYSRKGRKGRLVIGDGGRDCSRPAFPGRAYARKAPTPVGVEPLRPDRSPDRVGAGTGQRHADAWAEKSRKDGQGSYGFGAASLRRMLRARCSLISLWRGTGWQNRVRGCWYQSCLPPCRIKRAPSCSIF